MCITEVGIAAGHELDDLKFASHQGQELFLLYSVVNGSVAHIAYYPVFNVK
jgi:hypothetical protein